MAAPTLEALEERVAALEMELAQIRQQSLDKGKSDLPWWRKIAGVYKDDPEFEEAVRLGREYRESLRPPDYEAE